jgi:hypothetical protein
MAAAQEKPNDPTNVGSGELDPAAVLDLRRAIYAKGGVTRDDLTQLLARGRAAGPGACREYADLLAEAATDLLVRQVDPPGYVTPADADWLTGQLADGGGLSCRAEFAMLVDVLRYAVSAPPTLGGFAVREVEKAILTGRRAATGQADHAPGVVTSADVEALRSLLFAPAEGSSLHVSRESAESLFDIAHATVGAPNDPGFDDLFAKAIGNYLMGLSFRWTPTAAEAREHAQWADHATRFANFFSRMVEQPLARRFGGVSAATKTVDEIEEQVFAEENAADARALRDSGAIATSDADWVIAHLSRGGQLSPAEQRLLGFLAQEAASMPPSLRALVDKGA